MANSNVPDAVRNLQTPELRITICRDGWAQFEGTAAQLIDEGLIPDGFEWPRAAADKRWEAHGYTYWLRRERPEGHKGPMRSWLELDNWFVRVGVKGRDYHWRQRRELERRADELKEDAYRLTRAGSIKWEADWRRFQATQSDKAYQAFRAKVPALAPPPKRGRKPKNKPENSPSQSA